VFGAPARTQQSHLEPAIWRKLVAEHEAGHALVGLALGLDILHVDVDGGHNTLRAVPSLATRADVDDIITMILAGRAANEIFSGAPNFGAAIDLAMATTLATGAVAKLGLADSLVILSDERATLDRAVQGAVSEILDRCYAEARSILGSNELAFRSLVDALLERRYLDVGEVRAVIADVEDKNRQESDCLVRDAK
jgi:cell division protease FtsH